MLSYWNEERMGRLQTLYGEGMSFSLIAADIGVSRNAAIGKAHRMNLPKRIEITQCKPQRQRSGAFPRLRRRSIKVVAMKTKTEFKPEPGRDYRCTIYDLNNCSCRYPLWEAGTPHQERLYCGLPDARFVFGTPFSRPYCRQHAAVTGGRQF